MRKRKVRSPRTYYELRDSQVRTPPRIVSFYWDIVKQHRPKLSRVLDLGAGDACFSIGGHYKNYVGVEIDPEVAAQAKLPRQGRLEVDCAFRFDETGFDACIGNPPYVRHHDIESPWKGNTATRLSSELGVSLDTHCNLFLYFIALGLLKTHDDGLVAMIVPFEWTSRPSSRSIRDLLVRNQWDVSVYRFQNEIFDNVLTTACITVIDKRQRTGDWKFFDIKSDLSVQTRDGVSGTSHEVLAHSDRGKVWARRGMSPGSQDIFTLTEGQRIHFGLTLKDVVPCVTTLREVPRLLRYLNKKSFKHHFVDAGCPCWLIKSTGSRISNRVQAYLDEIPESMRQTYTCLNQDPWYQYEAFPIPEMLFQSGFTSFGPKVLINSIGAQAVGSVYGIHTENAISLKKLQEYLLRLDFESRVVAQAKTLKKVEVRQVNTVLQDWLEQQPR